MDALNTTIRAIALLAIAAIFAIALPVCLGRNISCWFLRMIGIVYMLTVFILYRLSNKASQMETDRFDQEEKRKDNEFKRQLQRDNGHR